MNRHICIICGHPINKRQDVVDAIVSFLSEDFNPGQDYRARAHALCAEKLAKKR